MRTQVKLLTISDYSQLRSSMRPSIARYDKKNSIEVKNRKTAMGIECRYISILNQKTPILVSFDLSICMYVRTY